MDSETDEQVPISSYELYIALHGDKDAEKRTPKKSQSLFMSLHGKKSKKNRRHRSRAYYRRDKSTWSLVLVDDNAFFTIYHIIATPFHGVNGTNETGRFVYGLEKIEGIQIGLMKDPSRYPKTRLLEYQIDIEPKLRLLQSIHVAEFPVHKIEEFENVLRRTFKAATVNPATSQAAVSQQWVPMVLSDLADAGFECVLPWPRNEIARQFDLLLDTEGVIEM
ncbi:hypothetical protein CC2G_002658 [Coprinopsis cinerea AmutBmut pab1-1]|nr:hypothetical protein CC2G_002658 [Coprinopsis cinerea AmutBmut pab1-1]